MKDNSHFPVLPQKIPIKQGKVFITGSRLTTNHLHFLKAECKGTACHSPSDKAVGVKEGGTPRGTVITVGDGDPCEPNGIFPVRLLPFRLL